MYMSIKVEGVKELEKKLKELEPKVGRKIVRQALHAGAKVIQKAQKESAKNIVGGNLGSEIARNIVVRAIKMRTKNRYGVAALINPKEESFIYYTKDDTRYYIPAAVEYGHTNEDGTYVCSMPFMRLAFDAEKENAANVIISELKKGIERIGAEK
ncbi:MAG: HK97 gp10 family phage protein [Sedimentisphaerales bacterium]|nr:HK97 gp10 family phage protein [Sedimentisphaerales bacterium]